MNVDYQNWWRALVGVLYCIGDCAYTPVERLLPIYRSEQSAKEKYDNFIFYTSQLHIHIEMAFGVMVKMGTITETNNNINLQHQTFDLFYWSSTQLLYQ